MEGKPLLRMEGIHKFYGSVHALRGVDFEVETGQIVGLIGDNGAGKSTLVEILAGNLDKSRGKIFWKGEEIEISSVEEARRLGIECVYQDQAVVGSLSVARNIFLDREPLKSYGPFDFLDKNKMNEEAEKMTERLALDISTPEQEVRFCSGGERQGVAIARAMYFDARLVILDEPTTALSVSGVSKVLDFIEQLKETGAACIFISHNLHHVYPVADKFVVFSKGEEVADLEKEKTSIEELEEIQVSERGFEPTG